jgi:hypothetical protein
MKDSAIIKIFAIACLTTICCVALLKGIDSTLTGSICAIIGGVAGYEFGKRRSEGDSSQA